MGHFDISSIGVYEMNAIEMDSTSGGYWLFDLLQALQFTVAAGQAYTEYSMKTGGEYVIHHAY